MTFGVRDVSILGYGMHPWGRWGHGYAHYAVSAARSALSDADVHWRDIQFVSAAGAIRSGIDGVIAGNKISQALGWQGASVQTSYGACVSGAQALAAACSRILSGECDLALVVGADESAAGILQPSLFHKTDDLEMFRHRVGISNIVYLGLSARRRMALFGTTAVDFARVKVKNSQHAEFNAMARFRHSFTLEQVRNSPMVCDPLRLFHLSSTSDGGAAVVLASREYALSRGVNCPSISAIAAITPRFPAAGLVMPNLSSDCCSAVPSHEVCAEVVARAYTDAGVGPDDMDFAEVYDLSASDELDWYEHLGFCEQGSAEALLQSGATSLGGARPVNSSGGLMSFGEAPSAQVIAQVCEIVLQLRGSAAQRQIANAKTGIAVSRGAYGSAAAVIVNKCK